MFAPLARCGTVHEAETLVSLLTAAGFHPNPATTQELYLWGTRVPCTVEILEAEREAAVDYLRECGYERLITDRR